MFLLKLFSDNTNKFSFSLISIIVFHYVSLILKTVFPATIFLYYIALSLVFIISLLIILILIILIYKILSMRFNKLKVSKYNKLIKNEIDLSNLKTNYITNKNLDNNVNKETSNNINKEINNNINKETNNFIKSTDSLLSNAPYLKLNSQLNFNIIKTRNLFKGCFTINKTLEFKAVKFKLNNNIIHFYIDNSFDKLEINNKIQNIQEFIINSNDLLLSNLNNIFIINNKTKFASDNMLSKLKDNKQKSLEDNYLAGAADYYSNSVILFDSQDFNSTTFNHELAHLLSNKKIREDWLNIKEKDKQSGNYLLVINKDNNFVNKNGDIITLTKKFSAQELIECNKEFEWISLYAYLSNSIEEDFCDSVAQYFNPEAQKVLKDLYPNRFNYLKELFK